MAHDAFISYSTVDKAIADATCATLENAGIRCWIAPRDITPGLEYGGAIVRAIDNCRVLILIFSSSANSSRQIPREVERAISKGVPVVPVRVENVSPTESLAYYMESVHWLDALTPPLENHLHRLADSVKALLEVAAPPGETRAAPVDAKTAAQAAAAIAEAPHGRAATLLATQAERPSGSDRAATGASAKPKPGTASLSVKVASLASLTINVVLAILGAVFYDLPDFVVVMIMVGVIYALVFRNLAANVETAKFGALGCAAVTTFFILENVRVAAAANWILAGVEAVSVGCLLFVAAKMQRRQAELDGAAR
jgi:hypothetical protein